MIIIRTISNRYELFFKEQLRCVKNEKKNYFNISWLFSFKIWTHRQTEQDSGRLNR